MTETAIANESRVARASGLVKAKGIRKMTAMEQSETAATEAAGAAASAATDSATDSTTDSTPRLLRMYREELRPRLRTEGGYTNLLAVPRLEKIVLNMGVGEAAREKRRIESAVAEMTLISGQRAVATRARRSVATFKLREGQEIGCKVTLRGARCYEFLDRLVNIALPRVRDFRGLSPRSFDGRGNYAFGLREQIVFAEIDYDSIDDIRGLDVIICTTARTDAEARALLRGFDLPFRD